MPISIQTILVPQGAEYRAVCRGLSDRFTSQPTSKSTLEPASKPVVKAIPVGGKAVTRYLQKLQENGFFNHQQVLVMGLCGSLTSQFLVADSVLYHECVDGQAGSSTVHSCDRSLAIQLQERLPECRWARGLTSDRIITNAQEKRDLGQVYQADVVDMEGFAVLDLLSQNGIAVAMLRIVSDDCNHHLPDLTAALGADGSLKALPLAMGMLRQPVAATRLIRGALQGLKKLESVTTALFSDDII